MVTSSDNLPPHYRRNFAAFVADYVSFGVAMGFMNLSSVVPSFVRQLTTSAPIIGLSSTLFWGGFQLPQMLLAHIVGSRPRKKPAMMVGTLGRTSLFVIAAALWAGLGRRPTAMLAVFIVGMLVFAVMDGLITINWFDIMARAIPTNRRGRMVGLSQIISGVLAIGAGALVGRILSASYAEPLAGYALLFLLAGLSLIPSTVALVLIWEPPRSTDPSAPEEAAQGSQPSVAMRDPAFRRLILCRLLVSGVEMATPFYVGHAQDVLYLPTSLIGVFVIAQTLGGIASSVLLGAVSERHGSRTVIRISSALAPLGPLVALTMHLVGSGGLIGAYPLTYAVVGAVASAWMLGYSNYTLEIAPEAMRSTYIGLSNTIGGIALLMPFVGGWVLQTTSYPVLFGMAAALGIAGFMATGHLRLPPRPVNDEP